MSGEETRTCQCGRPARWLTVAWACTACGTMTRHPAPAGVEVEPVDPDYDPRPYIAAKRWQFAKTMPANPHAYVLLRRSTDRGEHMRFLEWLRVTGDREKFWSKTYSYRTVDDYRYWALGPEDTIINRRLAPEAGGMTYAKGEPRSKAAEVAAIMQGESPPPPQTRPVPNLESEQLRLDMGTERR